MSFYIHLAGAVSRVTALFTNGLVAKFAAPTLIANAL